MSRQDASPDLSSGGAAEPDVTVESSSEPSLTHQSLLVLSTQLVAGLCTAAAPILIAHVVGPSVTGEYNYLLWICATLATLATLGVPTAMTTFVAKAVSIGRYELVNHYARVLLGIALLGTTVITAGLVVLCATEVVGATGQRAAWIVMAATIVPSGLIATATALLRGQSMFRRALYVTGAGQLVSLAILIAVLASGADLTTLAAGTAGGVALASIIAIAGCRAFLASTDSEGTAHRDLARYVAQVSGVVLIDQVVWERSEVLFLHHYNGAAQVGYYTLAYGVTLAAMGLIPGSVSVALLPRVAAMHVESGVRDIGPVYRAATRYVCCLVGLMVSVGLAASVPLVSLVYGTEYHRMVPAFDILLVTQGWAAVAGVSAVVFYGTNAPALILRVGAGLCVCNVGLDLLLIPSWGATGAATANGCVQSLGVAAGIVLLRRRGINFPARWCALTAGACAVSVVVGRLAMMLASTPGVQVAIGGLVSAAIYICICIASGVAPVQEIRYLVRGLAPRASNGSR